MEISKLTSKYQTTIPLEIRNFLGLEKGDAVRFAVENQKVVIEKARPIDRQFAKFVEATLMEEWNSAEDDEAYKDL